MLKPWSIKGNKANKWFSVSYVMELHVDVNSLSAGSVINDLLICFERQVT